MRLLGFNITRAKALAPVWDSPRSWWPLIREPFTGAWQRNMELRPETVLTSAPLFRCISLISGDIAKMRLKLVALDANDIWKETESAAFSPVLRKPNRFQNRIQFFANWMESKLVRGNTYALKERDGREIVAAMYVLDPNKVTPLVSPDGSVFYRLTRDDLSGLPENEVVVPASEIIHDRWNTLFHPLVGLSPLFACSLAASQGLKIQNNSSQFFGNGSNPGGVLTAPGVISDEVAQRLKDHWDANYTGQNVGKVAVLGDGLKYEPMTMSAEDSQLIEQLKWSGETVCTAFGVPAYKVGIGAAPAYNNIEALDAQYYAQCLQVHIEAIELCLDEGLGLDERKDGGTLFGTEFDLDNLLRMDTATLIKAEAEAVGAGIKSPNEARFRLNLGPAKGGESPYLQQQQFSLAALSERDQDKPFSKPTSPAPALPPPSGEDVDEEDDEEGADDATDRFIAELARKSAERFAECST